MTPLHDCFIYSYLLNLVDLETTKQSSTEASGGTRGTGTGSHYPASTRKLGPFLHDNGQQQPRMVHCARTRAKQDREPGITDWNFRPVLARSLLSVF